MQAAASPACEGHATLAGISVGGWIALATFAGIIVGIVATLLVQACCWRTAQEARAQVGHALTVDCIGTQIVMDCDNELLHSAASCMLQAAFSVPCLR